MVVPFLLTFPVLPLLWISLAILLVALALLVFLLLHQAKRASKDKKDVQQMRRLRSTGSEPEDNEYLPASELPAVFSNAMDILRTRVPGRDFRYRLPWFLLLGRPGAGKSTMFSESGLASALEEQVEIRQGKGISWNFFANGVVIDVGGWCFGSHPEAMSSWRRLLWLLVNHRPERALDGLVIALPASDFVGPAALSSTSLLEHAATLHQRLRQITHRIGFRLPIYCVLTKCDAIDGFNEFASELGSEEVEQIFGWSNHHGRDLEFEPEWVDEALNSMRVTLERTQSRLFAMHDYSEKRGPMFLFPGDLHAVIPGLRLFLSRVLRSTGDAPAPLFRGIYCCGSIGGIPWEDSGVTSLVPVSTPIAQSPTSVPAFLQDFAASWIAQPLSQRFRSGPQIAFVNDLFLKKIFVEKGLASPLAHHFAVRDRIRLILQVASVVLAVVLATGSALAYKRMNGDRSHLVPLLSHIASDLQSPRVADTVAVPGTDYVGASDLLHAMANFNTSGFSSIFIPASWFTDIGSSIEEAMVPAFRILVLQRFHDELQARTEQIADVSRAPIPEIPLTSSSDNGNLTLDLEALPEYQQMRAFVMQVKELQNYINVYDLMSRRDSEAPLQEIIDLDSYLHGRATSISLTEAANPYFQQAVRDADWKPFALPPDTVHKISVKTQQLTTALFFAWIENNPSRTATARLVSNLSTLSSPAVQYQALVRAQQSFKAVQTVYDNPGLAWVSADQFHMPADLAAVTTGPTSSSQFFEPWLRRWMVDVATQDFNDLVDALNDAETPLTGTLVEVDNGKISLTEKAQDVQVALDNLLNLPFIAATQVAGNIIQPNGQQMISWNTAALDATATLPVSYKRYLSEDLDQAPAALRQTFSNIATERLSVATEAAIADAEEIEAAPSTESEAALFQRTQDFADASASLSNLIGKLQPYDLGTSASHLRLAATAQASTLLINLNRLFDIQQPYGISTSLLDRWTGDQPPTVELFDAPTTDTLAAYLSAQRDIVRAYSNSAAALTQFLDPYRNSLTPSAAHALARWEAIGATFQGYDAKHPGNSIASLEDYITKDIDKVRLAQACVDSKISAYASAKPDYFIELRDQLRHDLHLRCEALLSENATSTYAALQSRFNRDVAGRFPFAPVPASTLYEADPQAIGSLYLQYETASDLLNAGIKPSAATQPVLSFLNGLSAGRPWFSSLLSTATAGEAVSLDFIPEFRVNRGQEAGGDQIIEWTLQVGNDTFHQSDPARKGHWSYGDPVVLTLRWAKNSPFLPATVPSGINSSQKVNGDRVIYTFKDPWSLLRFVATFGVPTASADTAPFTLKFTIPEAPSSPTAAKLQSQPITQTQIFIRLLISPPGAKETISQAILPAKAPVLSPLHASAGDSQ